MNEPLVFSEYLDSISSRYSFGRVHHEYMATNGSEVTILTGHGETTHQSLLHIERQLELNEFALQAAVISADANSSNYPDASDDTSRLFTGFRQYVD